MNEEEGGGVMRKNGRMETMIMGRRWKEMGGMGGDNEQI